MPVSSEADPQIRAQKLDEALDVLAGLWSGKRFEYQGRHYTVKPTRFRPVPVQQPRIPIWIAGHWGKARAPFRRAARWDGVCPEKIGRLPADARPLHDYIWQHRTNDTPFDIVRFAPLPQGTPAEQRAALESWAEVGVTWWITGTTARPGTLQALRQQIIPGPPRL